MATTIALKNGRALLLGGGQIADYQSVQKLIQPDDYILCADSGYHHCRHLGVRPHLLVGDFDSIGEALPPEVPTLPYPPEKDYTDTTLAMELLLDAGCRYLLLAGVLGGRLDHTLGNLQNLLWLTGMGVEATATDGRTYLYTVKDGPLTLPPREHYYFSVFSCTQKSTGVTIQNAKYTLHNFSMYFDRPRGISNEYMGKIVTISVDDGVLLVVETPMDTLFSTK